jgi:hypothetical protein
MHNFDIIDRALRATNEPMISYLFCLEFILRKIGRDDMLVFINRIKCPKRRHRYHEQLTNIFGQRTNQNIERLMTNVPCG